ncbi:MAG: flagellar hook-associated protein FlgK [Ignavibacteriaceae bacterium]
MSLSRIFDIARSSLAAYQGALDVTSHNVANAANENYSRQRVELSTNLPQNLAGMVWGTGVKIDQITRARNQLTDTQIRNNNSTYNDSSHRSEILSQVESLFPEPSDQGISSLITSFFDSWNELSVTPNSPTLRTNVVQAAQKLSSQVQTVYQGLDEVRGSLLNDTKSKVQELNSLLKQVTTLNNQIASASVSGSNNNDLLDQRDHVIDQLSEIANVSISYDNSNAAIISVGGVFAADQNVSTEFKVNSVNNSLTLTTSDGNSVANIKGGTLFASMDTYSNTIPQYQDNLNNVMNTLVESVNNVHSKGYTNTGSPETGINFFNSYQDGVLKINDRILSNNNYIAVSSDGTSGNGDIAVSIAGLSSQALINGSTISDSYSTLVSNIGNDKNTADQQANSGQLILQQLQDQKNSYSGVSIDEEMTNVITYQRSYDASAKLITVADQMLQTVLNLVQ